MFLPTVSGPHRSLTGEDPNFFKWLVDFSSERCEWRISYAATVYYWRISRVSVLCLEDFPNGALWLEDLGYVSPIQWMNERPTRQPQQASSDILHGVLLRGLQQAPKADAINQRPKLPFVVFLSSREGGGPGGRTRGDKKRGSLCRPKKQKSENSKTDTQTQLPIHWRHEGDQKLSSCHL